jgi:putative ABC transport system permease protein
MNTLIQDLRYGLRMLRKNPTFTAVAVLTLALGIGGNAAMFSVVNAVLLRPLPFHDPSRLVLVHEGVPTLGFSKISFSAPDLMLYQQGQKSFEGMAAYQNKTFEFSGTGEPERITGARVAANLFSLLGIEPEIGRSFRSEEDRPGVPIVMLSYGLWQSKYGASRDVVGRTVTLDRVPYTVIGVMPRDFHFPLPGPITNNQPAELWVPIAFTHDELEGWGNMFNNDVVARLKPGVTLTQARSEADLLAHRIFRAYPPALLKAFSNATVVALVDPMQNEVAGGVRPLLLVLQGAVGLVLLVACTNVAVLLLSRASGRSREIAVRAAMGAARSRLITQLLTESFILAAAGGALGLGLAVCTKSLLLKQVPAGISLPHQVPLDGGVLVFTLLTTLLTAVLFGLAPAVHATRAGIRGGILEGGRSGTASRTRHRVQSAFVIVEFGLALILMVGAGLLLRSFTMLLAADPGFQPERVLAMSVPLPAQAYPHATEVRSYYEQAIAQISQLPGVVSAAAANDLPLNGDELDAIEVEGQDKSTTPAVRQTWVLGDYLQTMGIPLLRGRLFTAEDRQGTQPVMVISQSMAQKLWPNEDAIGKRILRGGANAPWRTVVGIVGDVPDGPLSAVPLPHCYSPYLQESDASTEDSVSGSLRTLSLAVRTRVNPAPLAASMVEQLHRLDPALAVSDVRTMQTEVNNSVAPQRFNATLVGIYAALALLLALVGIYGVLAYMVMQQTHEIGIRMALGAQKRDILMLVVRHGMRLVTAGAAVGLLGAWGVTRLMDTLLYGIAPRDPLTFLGVTGLLAAAALLACYVPALRAARIDPMVALRYE